MCRQTVLLRGQHHEAGRVVALIHVLYIILEYVSFNIWKWALRGHFYSYVDSVWSMYNIGTGCHENAQVVFWVELPVQRILCPIFVKS